MSPITPPQADDEQSLPAHFKPGYVLTDADIERLRTRFAAHRDTGFGLNRKASALLARALAFAGRLRAMFGKCTAKLSRVASILEPSHVFLLVAFLVCLPLVWNIGYFSHDELQWLALADQPEWADIRWNGFFDFSPFQYRPLTFNLWLLLSHLIGYQPILMHLVRMAFALVAAWLLRSVLLRFDVSPRRAAATCWIWLLTPYAVYTHGWIGTYADSLCLIFMLMAVRFVLQQPARSWRQSALNALPVAALTTLALMSKESAVVFPVVFLIAAFRRRDKIVAAAFAAAVVVVLIYLGLRLQTILFPDEVSSAYRWSFANIPARLTEYTIFPFMVGHFEVIASRDYVTDTASLCLAIFAAALASIGWRRFTVFWLGWIVLLGPVLILAHSANHYAYLAGAFACACAGYSWNRAKWPAKLAFAIIAAVVVVHGIQEMRKIRDIGRVQHHLYADLMPLLARDATPIRVKSQRNKDDFVLRRLLNDIPSYHRLPVSDRVSVIDFADTADEPDYVMRGDGHLIPAR
jgi:hypothetical protein